ncbi:hypothetical protein HID58_051738 [Brassica napus]|uniref:Uncharacterized protein n=1 Tax=Brassica napus TaxID=3708 RepID=A0ABQ8A9T8_BRANA|nr:hypothetical protein HID58_051738 [Brassica napus]
MTETVERSSLQETLEAYRLVYCSQRQDTIESGGTMNAPLKLLEDKSNISTDEFTRTVDSLVVMYDIPSCLKVYKDRDRPSAVSLVKPSDEIRMKRIKKGT